MTYRHLLEKIKQLNDEQLDKPVTVYNTGSGHYTDINDVVPSVVGRGILLKVSANNHGYFYTGGD